MALKYHNIGFCPKNVENHHPNPFFRFEKVADYLEGLIDPFDLDVFTPHLNSNLNRLVQRTSVSQLEAMLTVNEVPQAQMKK